MFVHLPGLSNPVSRKMVLIFTIFFDQKSLFESFIFKNFFVQIRFLLKVRNLTSHRSAPHSAGMKWL
ncbi:hypothetical protein SUGI_0035590 [Cryptomeria japonica]|nr:hypothetical protein SUGI_0035590 [Cryptomeria japonica]